MNDEQAEMNVVNNDILITCDCGEIHSVSKILAQDMTPFGHKNLMYVCGDYGSSFKIDMAMKFGCREEAEAFKAQHEWLKDSHPAEI